MTKKPEKLDYKELVQLFQNDFPPFPNLPTQKNRSEEFLNSLKEKEKREEEARRLEEAKKNKNKPAPKQQQKKGENQIKYCKAFGYPRVGGGRQQKAPTEVLLPVLSGFHTVNAED